jgi:hypothetical protein
MAGLREGGGSVQRVRVHSGVVEDRERGHGPHGPLRRNGTMPTATFWRSITPRRWPSCAAIVSTPQSGHECVGERLDHRAQQIGTRRSEVVFGEGVQGHTVGCGHRADLLRASTSRRSAGGRSCIRTLTPTPGQTPGSGGSPYTTSQDATRPAPLARLDHDPLRPLS